MKQQPARVASLHLALTYGLGAFATLTLAAGALAAGPPGVKLDGTLGSSAAVLTGPTYNITQSLGRLAGGNLFFSFQYFNIATNQTALFSTTSAGINNVISRVTGGYASTIDGQIKLSAFSGAPDFYFINPSGVTFTANATVNVPAAFAVTTANYLKFSDGNFYADPTKASTLSALAPEAFGFLGTTRAPVDIEGSQLPNPVGGRGEFQVVAGDVTIDGGGQGAAINTTSGDVRVIATGSQAVEVPVTGTFNSTDGTVTLQAGARIYSASSSGSAAGGIYVSAGKLQIDGTNDGAYESGIYSVDGGTGAGPIRVDVAGTALLNNGGVIYSSTGTNGAGGSITLNAGALTIQGKSSLAASQVQSSASGGGAGGAIVVNVAGPTNLLNGGYVYSRTATNGAGGSITINTSVLTIQGENSLASSTVQSSASGAGAGGAIFLNVARTATMMDGGFVLATTNGAGNAGAIALRAGSLRIDGATSEIESRSGQQNDDAGESLGNAGQISVMTSGATVVTNGANITSASYAAGNAGNVIVNASSVSVAGDVATGDSAEIGSKALGLTGNAGEVTVSTGSLSLSETLLFSTTYGGSSGAVLVNVTGGVSLINRGDILNFADSLANAGDATANSGNVTVNASSLNIDGDSNISSGATSSGNGGLVSVTTSGATTITNGGAITTSTIGAGNAGNISLKAGSLSIDGAKSQIFSGSKSTGNGGLVSVTTSGATTITNEGQISSDSSGAGNAGNVMLKAGSLDMNGDHSQINSGTLSAGNGGLVSVTTSGSTTIVNGAEIVSLTSGAGNAGSVTLRAGSLTVEHGTATDNSAISTTAVQGSSGRAGTVTVDVIGTATVVDQGQISSATAGAAGQPGTVAISAGTLVVGENGLISIKNRSTVADPTRIDPTQIDIHAGAIQMNGGQISAASTGNIAASAVDISYQQTLHLDPSSITTSSNRGNGGPITITGQGPLWLENSSITTSVLGSTNGNGGDIRINVPYIVLDSGVIQANTTAPQASGGDVVISALSLIPSFESYTLGGSLVSVNSAILGQNVVQAAAPDGVSGTLNVTVPTLDLGSALLGLTGTPSTPIALSRSLCTYRQGSSLSVAGRGGLPVSYRDPLWIDLGAATSNTPAGAAPTADRSVSAPAFHGLSQIACR